MHLFEAITILFAGQMTLALAVVGGRVPRGLFLLPLACLAPLALHLLFEGARWQMTPLYAAVAGLCVFAIVCARRRTAPGDLPTRLAAIGGLLLLVASVAVSVVVR
jgi:hypothetical protein